jgi:hypothetical protein
VKRLAIAAHLPKGARYGGWIDRLGLLPAAAFFTVGLCWWCGGRPKRRASSRR